MTTELSSPTPMPERLLDEQLDVVGDALVGVVGRIALQLHAVVVGVVQPFAEIAAGHPAPPADLEPLVEVELVDRKRDLERCEHAENAEFARRSRPSSVPEARCRNGCATGSAAHRWRPAKARSQSPTASRVQPAICPRNGNREQRSAIRSRASSGCCSQMYRLQEEWPQRPEKSGEVENVRLKSHRLRDLR